MKKLLVVFMAALVMCMAVPTFAYSENESLGAVPVVADPIAVDGAFDAIYAYALKVPVNRALQGDAPTDGDAYFLCDNEWLYVYIDVRDTTDVVCGSGNAWEEDCVEVLFDTVDSGDRADLQHRVNSANLITGDALLADNEFAGVSVKKDGGYAAEWKFKLDKIMCDDMIHMTIMITDIYEEGNPAQYNLMLANSTENGGPWNATDFDYLTIGEKVVLPEPEADAPADTQDAAAEPAPATADALIGVSAIALASAAALVLLRRKDR